MLLCILNLACLLVTGLAAITGVLGDTRVEKTGTLTNVGRAAVVFACVGMLVGMVAQLFSHSEELKRAREERDRFAQQLDLSTDTLEAANRLTTRVDTIEVEASYTFDLSAPEWTGVAEELDALVVSMGTLDYEAAEDMGVLGRGYEGGSDTPTWIRLDLNRVSLTAWQTPELQGAIANPRFVVRFLPSGLDDALVKEVVAQIERDGVPAPFLTVFGNGSGDPGTTLYYFPAKRQLLVRWRHVTFPESRWMTDRMMLSKADLEGAYVVAYLVPPFESPKAVAAMSKPTAIDLGLRVGRVPMRLDGAHLATQMGGRVVWAGYLREQEVW